MEERYVTFEQAQRLKELGFPQITRYCYLEKNYCFDESSYPNSRGDKVPTNYETENVVPCCSCPTLSLVTKWLIENKYLFVELSHGVEYDEETGDYKFLGYQFCIVTTKDYNINDKDEFHTYYSHSYKSDYEEVMSDGIDKALEILENGRKQD